MTLIPHYEFSEEGIKRNEREKKGKETIPNKLKLHAKRKKKQKC